MSQIAVRKAIRDAIWSQFELDQKQCDIESGIGQPPPTSGQFFISIHPGDWRRSRYWKTGAVFDEEIGCRITVSVKNSAVQPQQYGNVFLQQTEPFESCWVGLEALCRAIAVFVHDNDDIVCTLNTAVGGNQYSGGIFFADGGTAKEQPATWWRAAESKPPVMIGLSQTMVFDGIRRTQLSGIAT